MLFEDYVSAANPFHWLTMVGALLIAVVLFAPKGLYGTAADVRQPPQGAAHDERRSSKSSISKKPSAALPVTNDVSLSMAPGDRVALIGPNGAGKTTFVNLVTGNLSPDSGEVRLGGEMVTKIDAIGRGQTRPGPLLSGDAALPGHDAGRTCGTCRSCSAMEETGHMFGNFLRMPEVMAEVDDLLGKLGLAFLMHRKVSEIAYGQQRLLEIAVALALKPKVLLLDEPAAGVPQSDTGRIEQALADLPADLAVLMIEHDMDLVFRFAKRVIVLAAGTIIFDGPPLTSPRMRACARPISGAMPMPAMPLEVENLSAGYGPTRVLEGISFSVPAGARLAVLGRNGMGKTTLLATLAGQTRRYDGSIRLGDSTSRRHRALHARTRASDMSRRRAASSRR